MAGAFTRGHPDRARAFRFLFSDRHLHHSQHFLEPAAIDLPTLEAVKRDPLNSDQHFRSPIT